MPSPKQLLDVIHIQTEIAKLGLDLGEVMSLVVERALPLIGAEGAVIELAEDEDMVYRATSGIASSHLGLRVRRGGSLSGLCVQTGEILRCDDSETDPRVDREACRKVGLRSMIVMPLRHEETTVGVLKAMSSLPGKFSEQDETLLGLLSEVVAAAMYFAAKFDSDILFHKATHDTLTDLANRSLFMDRLRNVMARGDRDHRPAGVLMIDMDGLKRINDTFGHRVGDAALKEFANRIRAAARKSDTVARLGGDEFAIILTPIDASAGIDSAVDRLASEIRHPFVLDGRPITLQASIGGALFPAESNDIDALLELADQRMYAIKQEHHRRQLAEMH